MVDRGDVTTSGPARDARRGAAAVSARRWRKTLDLRDGTASNPERDIGREVGGSTRRALELLDLSVGMISVVVREVPAARDVGLCSAPTTLASGLPLSVLRTRGSLPCDVVSPSGALLACVLEPPGLAAAACRADTAASASSYTCVGSATCCRLREVGAEGIVST